MAEYEKVDGKLDKDFEPIQYTENFRRARRNALTTSGLTIILAALSSDPTGVIHLTMGVREASFGQSGFLTLCATVATVFMAFGYRRAESTLLARHTGFALAHRLHESGNVAEAIVKELADVKSRIENAQSFLDKTLADLRSAANEASTKIERIEIIDPSKVDNQFWQRADLRPVLPPGPLQDWPGPQSGVPNHVQQHRFDHLKSQAENAINIATNAANQANSATLKWIKAHLQRLKDEFALLAAPLLAALDAPDLTPPTKQVAQVETSLSELSGRLKGFGATIGKGERAWFYWYYRAPVVVMVVLALVTGTWRLANPDSLHKAVIGAFPEPSVTEMTDIRQTDLPLVHTPHHPGTSASGTQSPATPVGQPSPAPSAPETPPPSPSPSA